MFETNWNFEILIPAYLLLVRFFTPSSHTINHVHQLNINRHEIFEVEYHRINHIGWNRSRRKFSTGADHHSGSYTIEYAARYCAEYDTTVDLPE